MRLRPFLVTVAALTVGASQSVRAQGNLRSQLGTVSQSIAGTKIELVYRRPVARGRALFGALVPWGQVWTPSADSGARITLSAPVEVNGSKLGAGSYSIWAIPDSTSWTVIFNSVAEVFHRNYPDGRDVLRVRATPTHGDHVESLMFSFPMADGDSTRLELRWGTTVVPLSIRAGK